MLVVGAGLAGLVAARDLVAAGVSTLVLEARQRVGGRLLTLAGDAGVTLDLGGQWIAREHHRARELANGLRLELATPATVGRATATIGGREVEMRGLLPAMGMLARADLLQAGYRLGRLVAATSLEHPTAGAGVAGRDEITAARWLGRNLRTRAGREIARAMVEICFAFGADETSLLGLLFDIRAARSISGVLGAQADIVVGGAQQLALRLADRLNDRVVTGAAVDRVSWSDQHIEIGAGGRTWTSHAAAICIPPALARRIVFTPALPADRRALLDGMLPGNVIKALAVYETPFWRHHGHSGSTFNIGSTLGVTADVSPRDESAGVLVALACASGADRLRGAPEQPEDAVLSSLVELFGEQARAAREVAVHDWSQELFTGGCYAGHFTPGTLQAAGGAALRPSGAIHWGGTETATDWHGYMEGAVRSGERVAGELTR